MLKRIKQYWAVFIGICKLIKFGFIFISKKDPKQQEQVIRDCFKELVSYWKVQITVEGAEHADHNEQYIIIANHQSQMDIPVLYEAIPVPMRMAAKHELFQIPLFGYFLKHGGFIPIYRGNSTAAIRALNQSKELFQKGLSLFMAPEGTRSKTGDFLKFKKGPFVMAIEHQKPILPIVLIGTRDVVRHGSLRIYPEFPIHVKILPPIPVKGLTYKDREALLERAFNEMSAVYKEGTRDVR